MLAGLALVAFLALAKRPDGDLAVYLALTRTVGRCATLQCVLSAGDHVGQGVLRDPAFNLLLVPFRGNEQLAIASLTVVTYCFYFGAALRLVRSAGLRVDALSAVLVNALILAIVPVSLGTHLLRQSLVTGFLVYTWTTGPKWIGVLAAALGALMHRGATLIALSLALVRSWLFIPALLVGVRYAERLPPDTLSYAAARERTAVMSVWAFVAVATLSGVLLRRVCRSASRSFVSPRRSPS